MAKQKHEKQPAQIYQLKITLEHSHPPFGGGCRFRQIYV